MNELITCAKCNSTQLIIQKRGYNLKDAMILFVALAILLSIIWGLVMINEKSNNDATKYVEGVTHIRELQGLQPSKPIAYEDNYLLWGGTVIILALSLLNGFVGADKNQRVCMNCGDVTDLSLKKIEPTTYNYID